MLKETSSKEWEYMSIVYTVGKDDTQLDIAVNFRNMTESNSSIYIKDIVIKQYTLIDSTDWNELENVSYKRSGKVVTVTRKSNVSVQASAWTRADQLPVDCRPTRNIEFPIAFGSKGEASGILRVDKWGVISLYSSNAQSIQYYTITFIV